jgi:hypothetical protein
MALLIALPLPLRGAEGDSQLIVNMVDAAILPRNFRTSQTPYRKANAIKMPSRAGLDLLHLSGSSQFSQLSWQAILQALNYCGPIYVIDLRQETHGFINGAAVSLYGRRDWSNRRKSDQLIQCQEREWLEKLSKQSEIVAGIIVKKNDSIIHKTKPLTFMVRSILSEAQLLSATRCGYLRLYVTDHAAPHPYQVDTFIQFVLNLPLGAWLHFHCAAGNGRTTTFMAMYDMMHNAKQISFEDIMARQYLIGGAHLLQYRDKIDWKYPLAAEKAHFLKKFYQYVKWNSDGFKTPWSTFLAQFYLQGH